MIEVRFTILRVIVDICFVVLLFFGFMCGIHYGTRILGMYFWFVKVLLGTVGIGAMTLAIRWSKTSASYVLKNASIYAQSAECNSVLGAISGMMTNFKSTFSISVFNKLIRESIDTIGELMDGAVGGSSEEGGEGAAPVSGVPGFLQEMSNTQLFKAGKFIVVKAYDYIDECILGYCYNHVSEDKTLMQCAVEGFILFFVHSAPICGTVLAVISIHVLCKIAYWIIFIAFCIKTFKVTLMNIIMCYVLGKAVEFILEDAIFEPALMHSVINQFNKYDWQDDFVDKISEITEHIPAIQKMTTYYDSKVSSGGDEVENFDAEMQDAVDSVENNGEV